MQLDGIHHITAITGDAPGNVDFYTRVLGLRLVKKTVNQDDPSVYHLFYADEHGDPGSDLTFFEFPGAARGRAGDGMVHRIVWRVAGDAALDFWAARLEAEDVAVRREPGALHFADPEGLDHELRIVTAPDPPLTAEHPEIPAELALQGFDAVRAYASEPGRSRGLFEQTLGFAPEIGGWEVRGERRGGHFGFDKPPAERGIPGAGTVHHVAFACTVDEQPAWRERLARAGARVTPQIDRFYFKSLYFREPSGVLFELATMGPGFAADEDPAHLGERLSLPPAFEHLREQVEARLTPIPDPRASWPART
jgi:glyoxalase family protein